MCMCTCVHVCMCTCTYRFIPIRTYSTTRCVLHAVRVVVVTTHLKAKEDFEAIRLIQAEQLFTFLAEFVETLHDDTIPVIVCGDFNASPTSPTVQWIETQRYMSVTSVYVHDEKSGDYTTWKIRPKGEVKKVIDYIWLAERNSRRTARSLMGRPRAEDICVARLPNGRHPSDHIPLAAEFTATE
eukprot:GHVS01073773.1.p1 GENE.GHVS01073773.1~~GHVS01073773.1.p1  ORF type:complete len:184 (-),score=20.03 GHVS01073773.1:967-1518(-)